MKQKKTKVTGTIPCLSFNFIEEAFILLGEKALPFYKRNIGKDRPPVSPLENTYSASAIILLLTGLDHHLCRLKYLRDIGKQKKAFKIVEFFRWTLDDQLSTKITKLLSKSSEKKLCNQLIELTVCRDCIIHPKFYLIEHVERDYELVGIRAKKIPGLVLKTKTQEHKLKKKELTKILRLPLVPTWVSYVDVVISLMVIFRFLYILEYKFGNPYAIIGNIWATKGLKEHLFPQYDFDTEWPKNLDEWIKSFYSSLSEEDKKRVKNVLGGNLSLYLEDILWMKKAVNSPNGAIKEFYEVKR